MKQYTAILMLIMVISFKAYGQIPPPPPAVPEPLPEIVEMEYFFDTDPGFGSGIAVPIIADSIVDEDFSIDISGLDLGRHLVYFRSRDVNGRWTLAHVEHINKAAPAPMPASNLPDITALEYFYNSDPGFGSGISVPVTADSITDEDFNLDMSSLDLGRHLVYFRTRDENGRWTLAHVEHINKAVPAPESPGPLPDIVALEYFYNSDPGFGSGISVPVTADSITDEDFNLDMSSLDLGRHLVYFRTRDENGRWTLAHVEHINKAVPAPESPGLLPDIVAMEYFIDTDPGLGSGTPIVMTADSLVEVSFDLDVSSWGTEVHILYLRALDELGRWSLVYLEPVTKGEISRRMRHGKFFFNGIEQPMFTEDKPD